MRAKRTLGVVRRDQIAQAVMELAAEHGVGSISVGAVAQRIGVATSALYRHFRSKHAMVAATLLRMSERVQANLARAREETTDPVAALERFLELQVELIRNSRGLPFVIFSEGLAEDTGHREAFAGFMQRFRRELTSLFEAGQATGRVRSDLPAAQLAVSFIGLYVPPAILWNLTRGRFDIATQARAAWTVFHDGIRVRPAPAARPPRPTRARRAQEKSA